MFEKSWQSRALFWRVLDPEHLFVYAFHMKAKRKTAYNFPVIIEKDESGYFVGRVPSLRSCYTQAKTLPELYKRLDEVIALCIQMERQLFKTIPRQNRFVGVHNIEYVK